MVATEQPYRLSVSGVARRSRCQDGEPMKWNTPAIAGAKPEKPRIGKRGWKIADTICGAGGGRKMFLTSPFIEQALSVFTNPFQSNVLKRFTSMILA